MKQPVSRRSFVVGTVSALAAAAVPAIATQSAEAAAPPGPVSVANLHRSTFLPLLRAKFTMTDGQTSTALVLSKIADLRPVLKTADPNRFSLLFTGPVSPRRPQGTYQLSNARLGSVSLLVVPVNMTSKTQLYQVIINRQ